MRFDLRKDQYFEVEKLAFGAFAPLAGFMNQSDFESVVSEMRLRSGEIFPVPVFLDVDASTADALRNKAQVDLYYERELVGRLYPEDIFKVDRLKCASKIFGTSDVNHPGVRSFFGKLEYFVGGRVELLHPQQFEHSDLELSPAAVKKIIATNGWKTVAGFQTRNVPHRAHEYLQRVALEVVDALFVQPLIGEKKAGDYTPQAVMSGYRALVQNFYPRGNVILGVLSTSMRYAGPREAVFHALIRRNYGCTHFIVGRDHAGVGNYYGKYEAQNLALQLSKELKIEILPLNGPFYCSACGTIATERTCPHVETSPGSIQEISGTYMRSILTQSRIPDSNLMRPEVVESLRGTKIFIEEAEIK